MSVVSSASPASNEDWVALYKKMGKTDEEIDLMRFIFEGQKRPSTNKVVPISTPFEKKEVGMRTQMKTIYLSGFDYTHNPQVPHYIIEDIVFDALQVLSSDDPNEFSFDPVVVALQTTSDTTNENGVFVLDRMQISGLFNHKSSMKWGSVKAIIEEFVQIAYNSIEM